MANNTNAFSTVSPIKQDMAGFVTDVENQDFKYREEKAAQEKLKLEQKEKAEAKQEKLRERILKTPTLNSTGVQSLDELNGRVLRQAIDRKFDIFKKLSEGGLSIEEQTALEVENKNIDNLPENLKLGNDNIQKWFADYDQKVGAGTAWQEDKIDKRRKNGYDAFVPTLDERGLPLIGFRDLDGDGKIDPIPWENIKDGTVLGNLQPKINYNTTMDNAAKALGTEETADVNGYKTITKKKVPLKNIEQYADSMMFENGIVSPFTLSRARELGLGFNKEELSPEELQKIRRDVINDIFIRTDSTEKEDVDFSAANAAASLNENKRQFDAKQKAEKPKTPSSKDFNNYTVITSENSNDKNDPRYGLPKGTKGYSFEGYNVRRVPAKDVEEVVETIYKTPDGKIVLVGKRYVGTEESVGEDGVSKTKGAKTEDFTYRSDKDANAVADFLSKVKNEETGDYFNSIGEFKAVADKKERGTPSKQKIDY